MLINEKGFCGVSFSILCSEVGLNPCFWSIFGFHLGYVEWFFSWLLIGGCGFCVWLRKVRYWCGVVGFW